MSKKLQLLCMAAILLLTALFSGCGPTGAKTETGDKKPVRYLRVVVHADSAPFAYMDVNAKDFNGFDIDIINAVAKEMGCRLKMHHTYFDGLPVALKEGKADVAISAITINDRRKGVVTFSKPYYRSGLILLVRADEKAIRSTDDLAGKTVGVEGGSTAEHYAAGLKSCKVKGYDGNRSTMIALSNGSIDAVICDRPFADYAIAHEKFGQKIKKTGELLTHEEYGIAVKKGNNELAEEINAALNKLKQNGVYDKIYKEWFDRASN